MIRLPLEIINYIFLFIESPTNKLMKYVIEDCYKEDYDPYTAEYLVMIIIVLNIHL